MKNEKIDLKTLLKILYSYSKEKRWDVWWNLTHEEVRPGLYDF